jgi:hypothetical protein
MQFQPRTLIEVMRNRIALLVAFSLISSAATCFAGEVVDRIERTYPVKERPFIYVRNSDGRVSLKANSGSEVRVVAIKEIMRAPSADEGRRQASRIEVRIEQVGNRVEVEAKYPKNWGSWSHDTQVFVHFEVSGPVASDLDAHSSDGSLDVEGFNGRLELSTSDGKLRSANCSGRITAHVSDGEMNITAAQGEVEARSSDGPVFLDGTFKGLNVKSSDGSVDITVRQGSVMERAWTINSSDGSIHIRLPEGFGADLDASTSDGNIRIDHPITLDGGTMSKNHMVGKLNKGGNLLRVHSSDGSVTISK